MKCRSADRRAVKIILLLVILYIFIYLRVRVCHQWLQWRGAYIRWKQGLPLRLWDAQLLLHKTARAKLAEEKRKVRAAYEISPSLILQPAFRKRFIDLGIGEDIKNEIRRKHGMVCAGCGCMIRLTIMRHVDHIKPKKIYPELEFLYSNLQVLCRPCNAHKSTYDGDDWKEVVLERRRKTAKRRHQRRGK